MGKRTGKSYFLGLATATALVTLLSSCWLLNNPLDPAAASFTGERTDRLVATRELVSFEFSPADNAQLIDSAIATIVDRDVTVTVPNHVDRSSLIPRFITTGDYVTVDGKTQESGVDAHDFTSPVSYVVHAANENTAVYNVTVVFATPPSFTAFGFAKADNPVLDFDYPSAVGDSSVTAALPVEEDQRLLIPRFEFIGRRVTVAGVEQTSGVSQQDFTNPVMYTVEGYDDTTTVYTVSVSKPQLIHVSATTGDDASADGSIDRPYRTLSAVRDAVSEIDATVEVRFAEGTYEGPVEVERDTLIVGGYSTDFTDRDPATYVSEITNPVVTGGDWDFGEGIDDLPNYTISFGGSVSGVTLLTGFTIHAGGGQDTAAILCFGASPSIRDNVVVSGAATGATIGIAGGQGAPSIEGNTITLGGGSAESYGVIVVEPDDYLRVTGNSIDAGAAVETSIGLYLIEPAGEVAGNSIRGGDAGYVTGMVVADPVADLYVEDNTIEGGVANSASSPSGIAAKGITISGGPGVVFLQGNTVSGGTTTRPAAEQPQTVGVELVGARASVTDNPFITGGESSFLSAGMTVTSGTITEVRRNDIHGVDPGRVSPVVEVAFGVYVSDTENGVVVSENSVSGNSPADSTAGNPTAAGVVLDGSSGAVAGVEVSQNTIRGGGQVQSAVGLAVEEVAAVLLVENSIIGSTPGLSSTGGTGVSVTNALVRAYRNVIKGGQAESSQGVRVDNGGELVLLQNRVVGSESGSLTSQGAAVDNAILRGGSNLVHSGMGTFAHGVAGTGTAELYLYNNTVVAGHTTSTEVYPVTADPGVSGEIVMNILMIGDGTPVSGFVDGGSFAPGSVAGNNVHNVTGVGADGSAVAGPDRNIRLDPELIDFTGSDGFHWTIEDNDWGLQPGSPRAVSDGVIGDSALLSAWLAAIDADPVDFYGVERSYEDQPVSMGAIDFRGGSLPKETDLHVWLSAEAIAAGEGELVSSWPNLSGLAGPATAPSGFEPTYREAGVGGRPSLEFSGAQRMDLAAIPSLHGTNQVTVAVAAQPQDLGSPQALLDTSDGSGFPAARLTWDAGTGAVVAEARDGLGASKTVALTATPDGAVHAYGFKVASSPDLTAFRDGDNNTTPISPQFNPHVQTTIGDFVSGGAPLSGQVAAVLIWGTSLTAPPTVNSEVDQVGYFLSARYGINYGP